MADTLQIEIVTPQAAVFSGEASEVLLPAWDGQMGVYPMHDTLLALLRAGSLVVTTASGTLSWVVGRGFADIGPDRVTLLTDSCTATDHLDKADAQKRLTEAQQAIATKAVGSAAHAQAQIAAEQAQAVLDA